MRIISWNCKGAFHKKHAFAEALRPDILIVPECEKFSGLTQSIDSSAIRSYEWFGTNPRKGLAVISYGDYALEVHPNYEPRHQWVVPLSISGPATILLFAVWTLPLGDHGGRYVRPLFEAFEAYKPLMNFSEIVWAGDFNSSFLFDTPSRKYKFRDFVTLLAQYGIHSLYHHQRQCEHGKEPEKTFYLHHHGDRGHHIDYVFTSEAFHAQSLSVSIGLPSEWLARSDHLPLICDVKGSRIAE